MVISYRTGSQLSRISRTPIAGAQRFFGLYWSITYSPFPSCDYDPRIARRMRYDAIDFRRRAPGLLLFRRHLGPDFDPYV